MMRRSFLGTGAAWQRLLQRGRSGGAATQPALPIPMPGRRAAGDTVYAVIAVLVPAFLFLYGLDRYPLRDNNEGLYAEIAREMLATGQFMIPHLNGVPYIEKPPLLYWLIALSMSVFGPSAASARLVSAAAMFGLAVCLFRFGRRHGHAQAGCYASVGLASAVPVLLISHTVLFDPLLTALLGLCLLSFFDFCRDGARRAYRISLFWLALAVLEKGLVALVLAAGIAGLFLLLAGERKHWRALADPPALAILLALSGWWHLAALFLQDGFGWFYFINEHLLRFLGTREPHDYHLGPSYYYLSKLLLMMLPWTPFLLLLVGARSRGGAPVARLCQAWIVFPLVFFSLSQAKAQYYLLVAAPALALWLGSETASRMRQAGDRTLACCWGMSAAACTLAPLALLGARPELWRGWPLALVLLAGSALALAGARVFVRLGSVRGRELALMAVVLAAAPLLALLLREAGQRSSADSSWHLARLIQEQPGAPRTVLVYRDFEDVFSTLPFYLGHTVPVIDSASRDLVFGCRARAGVCLTPAQFGQLDQRLPLAVAVRADRAAAFLAMAGAAPWRVERIGDKMLFLRGD